jgi:DNA polymerase-3 subunit alpha
MGQKIIAVKPVGKQQTYNLHVKHSEHNYILANGVVSGNSHSFAYSILGYWECWLKTYYPVEFMAALMSAQDKIEKIASYISECRDLNIKVHGPDINTSNRGFTIHNGELYFGLESIKGLGKTAAYYIVKARGNYPFTSFEDFMSRINRTKITSTKIESLVAAGAFDNLKYNRIMLFKLIKDVVEYYKELNEYREKVVKYNEREAVRAELIAAGKSPGRMRSLKSPTEPVLPTINRTKERSITLEEAELEKSVLGCYLSIHPTDFITNTGDTDRISDIYVKDQQGKINAIVCNVKEIKTKKGQLMAFLDVEDQSGMANLTVFPSTWNELKIKPENGSLVRVMYTAETINSTQRKLIVKKIRMIKPS